MSSSTRSRVSPSGIPTSCGPDCPTGGTGPTGCCPTVASDVFEDFVVASVITEPTPADFVTVGSADIVVEEGDVTLVEFEVTGILDVTTPGQVLFGGISDDGTLLTDTVRGVALVDVGLNSIRISATLNLAPGTHTIGAELALQSSLPATFTLTSAALAQGGSLVVVSERVA